MSDELVQLQLYVNGYLAAWATVRRDQLLPHNRRQFELRTDKVHDTYGMFDDVVIHVEAESRFFHPSARTD